ncbi:MAG: HupE/UreJ family protein [Ilumatobacter sp.]
MIRALTVAALALMAVLGPVSGTADAHSGKQSYLYISVFDDGVEGRVEMPVVDLAAALEIELPTDVAGARSAVDAMTPTIRDYAIANTSLGDTEGPWKLDFDEQLSILPTENGPYVLLDFAVDEPFDTAPRTFVAEFSVIIESNPEKDALLLIENDWGSATFINESEPLLGFSIGATEQTAVLDESSTLQSMGAVRGLGTDAIRTGIDLLLLVAAVTLLALTARSENGQLASLGETLQRTARSFGLLVLVATPVLWLIGLGAASPPSRAVGIVVSLALGSIAVVSIVARLAALRPMVLTTTTIAAGAVLGAGLGRLFIDAGLDRRSATLSLISFEVGVLAATVLIVACMAGPLLLLRDTRLFTLVSVLLGIALIGYSIAWLGERGLDTEWPIEEVANPLRVWPRNFWFVAAALGAAALWRRIDGGADTDSDAARIEEPSTS